MSDTTTEAVGRLANNIYAAPMTYCADAREALRALAARVTELEASLKRWEKAAEKGAIYTRKDLEDAVAAAVQTVLDDVGYTYEQLGEEARTLIKDPSILARADEIDKGKG